MFFSTFFHFSYAFMPIQVEDNASTILFIAFICPLKSYFEDMGVFNGKSQECSVFFYGQVKKKKKFQYFLKMIKLTIKTFKKCSS